MPFRDQGVLLFFVGFVGDDAVARVHDRQRDHRLGVRRRWRWAFVSPYFLLDSWAPYRSPIRTFAAIRKGDAYGRRAKAMPVLRRWFSPPSQRRGTGFSLPLGTQRPDREGRATMAETNPGAPSS